MDYFGINSAADLPKIKEVLADQIVEGTIIKPEDFTDNQIANAMAQLPSDEVVPDEEIIDGDVSDLTVNEEGELIIAELNESSDSEDASTDESSNETNDDSENLSTDVEDENNPQ
jgi:segregation and condensation protein B